MMMSSMTSRDPERSKSWPSSFCVYLLYSRNVLNSKADGKKRQDITGSNWLKGVLVKVIVDEKGIKDSWKEYMEIWWMKRMNGIIEYWLELKKDQQIASGLMKLLQHWKRWKDKAPGLSGFVAEMVQATGDIGTHGILDLCSGVVKEGSILEVKCGITNLQRERGSNGVWILQRN